MKPPYELNSIILNLIASISEKIGEVNAVHLQRPQPELRKKNRIKTIQASLAIEGNTLTEEQITALFENKRVAGPQKDIQEVLNAIQVYESLNHFDPFKLKSFFKAHAILMKGLISDAGKFRTQAVGIVQGSKVTHLAPPAGNVHYLMESLFRYLKTKDELVLIKSCVFHYEMEFIHPFTDGNGRMGRLWQTLILMQEYPVFEYLPLETLIKEKQKNYYAALSESDQSGNSTKFMEFMLGVIDQALSALLLNTPRQLTAQERIEFFRPIIKNAEFTRKEYMRYHKDLSTATASRDLKMAVELEILERSGDKRLTIYKFKR